MEQYLKLYKTRAEYDAESNKVPVSHIIEDIDVKIETFIDPCSDSIRTTYEAIDLGLPSGLKWANKNIGALLITDYGQKFSWGGVSGYTNSQISGGCRDFSWDEYELGDGGSTVYSMNKYNTTDGKKVLEATDDAASIKLGGLWRMPTENEFKEIMNTTNCSKTWVSNYNESGINGYLFTSKRNGNTLFLPAAGYCYYGTIKNADDYGYYWTSSLYTSKINFANNLSFNNGSCSISSNGRYCGLPVRAVSN